MDNALEDVTIGKGTWLDKVAFSILEREKNLVRSTKIIKSRKWIRSIRNSTYWKYG